MKILFIALPKNIAEGAILQSAFRHPPVTYLWLASILEKGGHVVSILDALSLHLNEKDILQNIKEEEPDLIGFTVFTNAFYDVTYIAKRIKELFPKIRIAVGGYHVNSLSTDFYLDQIDYIFAGETEYSLLELANRLEKREESKDGILGLTYREPNNGEWVVNPPTVFRTNFDDQPLLPYEKILNNNYTTWWRAINPKRHKYMTTITGKGCPMKCSFCDISKTEGTKYRSMSVERVLDELTYMKNLGITHIEFLDPFFTVDIKRTVNIAQGIIDRKLKIEWGCTSTINIIKDEEYLKLLCDSGCRFIFYGVESGNPQILKREKRVTLNRVVDVVRMTQRAGLQAHCSFIFGLDGETEKTMQETIDFALRLNPNTASFSIAVPYPGTQMYSAYVKKGHMKTSNWRLYGGEDAVFETETVNATLLNNYLKKAHKEFYFRPSYLLKRLLSIRSFEEIKLYASFFYKMLFDVMAYKR